MKAALTAALFLCLAVGTVSTVALLAVLPWYVAPLVGIGAWQFWSATVEALHAVRGVPTC